MRIPIFAAALSIISSSAFAVLEIPNAQPKVHANEWKWVLDSTWAGLKRRNIEAYRDSVSYGLIHRPKSEYPGDAVSEGVGYGMLLALYSNDQTTFDLIYNTSKKSQFNLYYCKNWHWPYKSQNDGGSATDADEDIALALIFADKLKAEGKWGTSSINYANEAQSAVNCVWNSLDNNGQLWPGNNWKPGYNLGYFAPAWYRIFDEFSSNRNHNWQKAVDASYSLIERVEGYDKGMVPDWIQTGPSYAPGGGSYNSYAGGKTFFKDAIRILWRIANDYIWFKESRAKTFLENARTFINEKGGPDAANFYQLEGDNAGEPVPEGDKWIEFNNEINRDTWRYRREHSWLTVGQWLTAVMAVGTDKEKIAWSKKMAEFYEYDVETNYKPDFFGLIEDPAKGDYETSRYEDTTHNEMYFDQFLAWFGVSLMSGTWMNVIAVLDNPVENEEGIPGSPFREPPDEPIDPIDPIDPDPPEPIIAKSNKPLGIQINQSAGILRLYSQSDVVWKIHSLQGKLLFTSNSKEVAWNAGNFKGAIIVSAINGSNAERKLVAIR